MPLRADGSGLGVRDDPRMLAGLDNPFHILLVLVVVLLLFGAKRLPELGRSLGTGMREFKDSVTGATRSTETLPTVPPSPPDTRPDHIDP